MTNPLVDLDNRLRQLGFLVKEHEILFLDAVDDCLADQTANKESAIIAVKKTDDSRKKVVASIYSEAFEDGWKTGFFMAVACVVVVGIVMFLIFT